MHVYVYVPCATNPLPTIAIAIALPCATTNHNHVHVTHAIGSAVGSPPLLFCLFLFAGRLAWSISETFHSLNHSAPPPPSRWTRAALD